MRQLRGSFYYVLCVGSRQFAYMPGYDRSGYAVAVEMFHHTLHTCEAQAVYISLVHPCLLYDDST